MSFLFSLRSVALSIAACLCGAPVWASEQAPIDYRLNEQVIKVPAAGGRAALETTVFRPNGAGPFPLLVVNHGKEPGEPASQTRERFIVMATAFVKRGYAVMVPMRQGFASSTGVYANHGCNMTANGYAQASDVRDTLAYARRQKWVDREHMVVAGQSYGGLATIALGTQAIPGLRGLINFAGGLRDDAPQCDWQAELVRAFGEYGAASKVASLWLYGVNDSLFEPALASRMHQAFTGKGGKARLVSFGAFKNDSHGVIASRDGEKIWLNETLRFLSQVGMPVAERYRVAQPPMPPRTDYARVDDVDAVPFVGANGREAYRHYLAKATPRAFAVSPSGAWCWAEEGEEPAARALKACAEKSDQPCQLYSVDDYVVFKGKSTTLASSGGSAGGH